MTNQGEKSVHKIAIFGIQNAGKTSIIKVLKREFELLKNLKPTIKVERSFLDILGKDVMIWDYGGQEKYRDEYLNKPERFFSDVAIVFYVLDIQDPTLLGSNIMYFDGLFKRVMKYSPNSKFVLLFHKLDPDLKIPDTATKLHNEFLKAISYHFDDSKKKFEQYNTSIYNPISIIKAFSQSLINKEQIQDNISEILSSFAKSKNLLFASTLTEQFIELGYYLQEDLMDKYPETMGAVFNDIHKNLEEWLNPKVKPKAQFGSIGLLHALFAIQTDEKKIPIFTTIGFGVEMEEPIEELQKSLDELNEEIVKLLKNLDINAVLSLQ